MKIHSAQCCDLDIECVPLAHTGHRQPGRQWILPFGLPITSFTVASLIGISHTIPFNGSFDRRFVKYQRLQHKREMLRRVSTRWQNLTQDVGTISVRTVCSTTGECYPSYNKVSAPHTGRIIQHTHKILKVNKKLDRNYEYKLTSIRSAQVSIIATL